MPRNDADGTDRTTERTDREHDGIDRTTERTDREHDESTSTAVDRQPPGVANDEHAAIEREDAAIEREDAAIEREDAAIEREDAAIDHDEATDGTGTPELTWFERAFVDRPVVRDLLLFAFLAAGYGGGMALLAGVPATWGVGMGVAFAIAWLALMEAWARRRGESMLRSIGDDPYAAVREREA